MSPRSNSPLPTRNVLLAIVAATAITACSMVQIGYSLAPTLINWQIYRYVTLNARQQNVVDNNLEQLHGWHCRTQLPRYVGFLESMDKRLAVGGPFPVSDIERFRRDALPAWQALINQVAPVLVDITLTLTETQFTEIEARMAKDIRKLRDRYKSLDKRQRLQSRQDSWQDLSKFFLGKLTLLQQARLSHAVARMTDPGNWWEHRDAREKATLQMMRRSAATQPPREPTIEMVRRWMLNYGTSGDPITQRLLDRLTSEADELISRTLSSATPAQLRHARELIADYAQELRGIDDCGAPKEPEPSVEIDVTY